MQNALVQRITGLGDFASAYGRNDAAAWFVPVRAVVKLTALDMSGEFGKTSQEFRARQMLQTKALKTW